MSVAQLDLIGYQPRAAARAPEIAPSFTLRPYQQEADAAIDRELGKHRSTLVIMATGTGKTVLFASQARKRGGALVLAHRDSLIKQAAKKLRQETGEYVAIEKAERTAFASPYICASVQTLKGARLDDFASRFRRQVRTIVIDEAHRATAKSYRAVFDAFPDAQLIGVTATGDRADGVGMGNVFDSEAFRYEITDATSDGWLTPHRFVPIFCDADLDKLKLKGKGANRDFDQAALDDLIAASAGDVARSLLDQCGAHRLIVFTPGVKTAHVTSHALNLLRPGCAAVVDGETDDVTKERIQDRHQGGEFQYLLNCRVYVEGYDDPNLDGIFDQAPTQSRIAAAQKWGRPNRLWDNGTGIAGPTQIWNQPTAEARRAAIAASPKPWAVVYDLACNSDRHMPIGPADILSGKSVSDEDRKRINAKLRKDGGDVVTALAELRAEQEAERRASAARAARLAERRRSRIGQARTIWDLLKRRDPAAPARFIRPEDRPPKWAWGWMRANGVSSPPSDMTKGQFFGLYREAKDRAANGLANIASIERLNRYGIDARNLLQTTAVRVLNAIAVNRGRPLHPATLDSMLAREAGE